MRKTLLAVVLALGGCKASTLPVSKPGATKEQADLDIQQCEDRARAFTKGRTATARDQSQAYNRLVMSCLRDRGYTVAGD